MIIFTAHAQPDLLTLALRAGASGYVLKSAPSEDIARAIEVVAGGGTFVGTELGQGAGEVEKLLELTPREREILELLAEGLRVKQIADRLSPQPRDRPYARSQRDRAHGGGHPDRGGRARRALQLPRAPAARSSSTPRRTRARSR